MNYWNLEPTVPKKEPKAVHTERIEKVYLSEERKKEDRERILEMRKYKKGREEGVRC